MLIIEHVEEKNNMKKCIFIVPYFGKLPDFFPIFLKSCKYNPTFNWLIITNDETDYDYPLNVSPMYMSFSEFKEKTQSKFDFPISLDTYQKLCDYKPSYGYLLEDKIENYKFWGFCDIDVILGDLEHFITDDMLDQYDKIFELGHCTLIRNTPEINRTFMEKINGISEYKKSFMNNKVTIFDEVYGNTPNVNDIFLNKRKKVFGKNYAFDIQTDKLYFQNSGFDYKTQTFKHEQEYRNKLCVWDKGILRRFYQKNGVLKSQEYMYVYLQDRKVGWTQKALEADRLLIIPNYIMPLPQEITYNNFKKIPKLHLDVNTLRFALSLERAKLRNKFKFSRVNNL